MDVALIGLGLVGSALAERFCRAGFNVIGYDPRPEASEPLLRTGGRPTTSSRAAAESASIIVLSLPDSNVVEGVIAEIEPVVRGRTIVDTTTGDPAFSAKVGAYLKTMGVDYLDATIAGSSAQVREGNVLILAGGEEQTFNRMQVMLSCFATKLFLVGPWGSGARMKLVFNLVLGLNRAVLAEGLSFAKACGLDAKLALEVLKSGAAYSSVMDSKGPKMLSGDFTPVARLSQHHKDVKCILAAAEKLGIELPLSHIHDLLLSMAELRGFRDSDNSAIIRAYG